MASGGKVTKIKTWTVGSKAPKYLVSAVKDIGKDEKTYREYFNERIEKWLGYGFDVKAQPWCATWVGVELEEDGFTSTKKANARSYLNWGTPVSPGDEREGDIVIFWRGTRNDGVTGHVGFILSANEDGFYVLGGNQGDKVSIEWYSRKKLLGVRRYQSLWKTTTTKVASTKVGVGVEEIARHSVDNPTPDVVAVEGTKTLLEQMLTYTPNMGQTVGAIILALGLYLLYKQIKDSKNA